MAGVTVVVCMRAAKEFQRVARADNLESRDSGGMMLAGPAYSCQLLPLLAVS